MHNYYFTQCIYFLLVGINVNLGHSSICVKAILLTGVYDIPGKSDVLGFGSHRGPYACTKCLHPGEVIRTQRGTRKYFQSTNHDLLLLFYNNKEPT